MNIIIFEYYPVRGYAGVGLNVTKYFKSVVSCLEVDIAL